MARKKKGKNWVSKHRRSDRGKRFTVSGYWRKKRPKGKRRIVSKKPHKFWAIRDEYGQVVDYTSKPPRKRR